MNTPISLEGVVNVSIEKEIKNSFIDYSMSVIVSRALPDVRDGLKPVHRRILFTMYSLKNFYDRPYLKSARIVGDVMGKYHPHGDSAIYDALVRLAQPFSLRYPLIDGQGNFGSVDGDSAASMRYTESRMQKLTGWLLEDLDLNTVDFQPNYDNKELEPTVLPARYPQLLINGTSGIAVGMATNIPPHNIVEIIDGIVFLVDNPQAQLSDLMNFIKGPDFPTGAQIQGMKGIVDAYQTGRGSIQIKSICDCEIKPDGRGRVIIREIPYQVNKAKLIEKIAELVKDDRIQGISDIRDESAKNEIRVVVELKKGELPEVVLNNLYNLTPLQTGFGINMVALVDGLPRTLSLKEMLYEFIRHRKQVILRRTRFLLEQAEEKEHILAGFVIVLDQIDELIGIIKKSVDTHVANVHICERFGLSQLQAKAILEMRLSRLTSLEQNKIRGEQAALLNQMADYRDILADEKRVISILKSELIEVKELFKDERRTQILPGDISGFSMESLVADEPVAVTLTSGGYIKRTPIEELKSQRRGGQGQTGMLTKDEDSLRNLYTTSNHQNLLCFTDYGRIYSIKVYQIPEGQLRGRGTHLANLLKFEKEKERVVSILPVAEFNDATEVAFVTKKGLVKKTQLLAFSNVRSSGIQAIKLEDSDELVSCALVTKNQHMILVTKTGKAIRFTEEDIRSMGRTAAGVIGVRIPEAEDGVVGLEVVSEGDSGKILCVSENGYGKRTPLDEYRLQGRGGHGIYTQKVSEKTGALVAVLRVDDGDDVLILTSSGKIIRFCLDEVRVAGRLTSGVRLVRLNEGEKVISVSRILPLLKEELAEIEE